MNNSWFQHILCYVFKRHDWYVTNTVLDSTMLYKVETTDDGRYPEFYSVLEPTQQTSKCLSCNQTKVEKLAKAVHPEHRQVENYLNSGRRVTGREVIQMCDARQFGQNSGRPKTALLDPIVKLKNT